MMVDLLEDANDVNDNVYVTVPDIVGNSSLVVGGGDMSACVRDSSHITSCKKHRVSKKPNVHKCSLTDIAYLMNVISNFTT